MSYTTLKQNSPLQFLDRQHLTAERLIIDNYVSDIIKNYGVDVLYISQKKNFPIVPRVNKPSEHSLLFHAYGDYIKPEYNEPFVTRVYIRFDTDLFALNQFGLSNDMSATLFFSKMGFAFDSAIALADNETITKKFKFRSTINAADPICTVKFADKDISFDATFNWQKTYTASAPVSTDKLTLSNVKLRQQTIGNEYLYASFNRRYSAKQYVALDASSVSYVVDARHNVHNEIDISGTINCSFIIKNPYKSYTRFEKKLTPAVGDIIFVQTIDDKFERLEITEVLGEQKTFDGLNPLLGSYSYQCACKPFIADNATPMGRLESADDLEASKLETIELLSHNASKLGSDISYYQQLYTDQQQGVMHQDGVYGGYELTETASYAANAAALNVDEAAVPRQHFYWNEYAHKPIVIDVNSHRYDFTADDIYTQLLMLFDIDIMQELAESMALPPIDYSMFNLDNITEYVEALNCRLYYSDLNMQHGYLQNELIIRMCANDTSALISFIDNNPELIEVCNASYIKGFKSTLGLPYLASDVIDTYAEVINDKLPHKLVQVTGLKYVKQHNDNDENGSTFIPQTHKTEIIVDLHDIEHNNISTEKYAEVLHNAKHMLQIRRTDAAAIDIKFVIGELITVWQFNDAKQSRLATNGLELFFETRDNEGQLYRSTALNLIDDMALSIADKYHDKTVIMPGNLSWLTADAHGIYFNPVYGNKTVLYGDANKYIQTSVLLTDTTITSTNGAFIISFNSSPHVLTLIQSDSAGTVLNTLKAVTVN